MSATGLIAGLAVDIESAALAVLASSPSTPGSFCFGPMVLPGSIERSIIAARSPRSPALHLGLYLGCGYVWPIKANTGGIVGMTGLARRLAAALNLGAPRQPDTRELGTIVMNRGFSRVPILLQTWQDTSTPALG